MLRVGVVLGVLVVGMAMVVVTCHDVYRLVRLGRSGSVDLGATHDPLPGEEEDLKVDNENDGEREPECTERREDCKGVVLTDDTHLRIVLCNVRNDNVIIIYIYIYIHRVSKKTVQNCFCQNFVKCPPILINLSS